MAFCARKVNSLRRRAFQEGFNSQERGGDRFVEKTIGRIELLQATHLLSDMGKTGGRKNKEG